MQDMSVWKERLECALQSSSKISVNNLFQFISEMTQALGRSASDELVDKYPELSKYGPELAKAYYQFVVEHDRAEANRIIQLKPHKSRRYTEVASERSLALYRGRDNALDHIDFRNCQRFVMVGCGRNPFTIFHIHDKTSVPGLVGLDIVPEAVDMANRLATALGYNRARVELGSGQDYDYKGAQVVHIASMVSPKSAIISRIADTAPATVQIILRDPCGLGRLWAKSAEATLDPRLHVIGRQQDSPGPTTDVYLARRDSQSAA